jgi:hypothetical protein
MVKNSMKFKRIIKYTALLSFLGLFIQYLLTTYEIPKADFGLIFRSIIEGSTFQNPIERFSLIIIWLLAGLFVYIIYLSIDETYEHLKELFVYETSFVNKNKNKKMPKNKHIPLFLISIISYIFLFASLIFLIYPASVFAQKYLLGLLQNQFGETITLTLSFLPSLMIWFLVLFLLEITIEFFKVKDKEITFSEEHIQK